MKQALNKGSCENKSDPQRVLRGSEKGWGGRTTFGEVFSYQCTEYSVLIIPLFPQGEVGAHILTSS